MYAIVTAVRLVSSQLVCCEPIMFIIIYLFWSRLLGPSSLRDICRPVQKSEGKKSHTSDTINKSSNPSVRGAQSSRDGALNPTCSSFSFSPFPQCDLAKPHPPLSLFFVFFVSARGIIFRGIRLPGCGHLRSICTRLEFRKIWCGTLRKKFFFQEKIVEFPYKPAEQKEKAFPPIKVQKQILRHFKVSAPAATYDRLEWCLGSSSDFQAANRLFPAKEHVSANWQPMRRRELQRDSEVSSPAHDTEKDSPADCHSDSEWSEVEEDLCFPMVGRQQKGDFLQ